MGTTEISIIQFGMGSEGDDDDIRDVWCTMKWAPPMMIQISVLVIIIIIIIITTTFKIIIIFFKKKIPQI